MAFLSNCQPQASAYSTLNHKKLESQEVTPQSLHFETKSRANHLTDLSSRLDTRRSDFSARTPTNISTDRGRDALQKSLSQRRSKLDQLTEGPSQRRASRGGQMSFRGTQPGYLQREGYVLSSSRPKVSTGSSLNQRLQPSRLSPKTSTNNSRTVSRRNSKGREGGNSRAMTSRSRLTDADLRSPNSTYRARSRRAEPEHVPSVGILKYSESITAKPKPRSPGPVDPHLNGDGSRGVIRVSSQKVLSGSHSRSSSVQNNQKAEETLDKTYQNRAGTQRTLPARGYTPSTYQLDDSQNVLPEATRTLRTEHSPQAETLLSARRKEHKQNTVQSTPQSNLTEELLQFPIGRLGKETSTQRTSVVDDAPHPERRSPSAHDLGYKPADHAKLSRAKLDEAFDLKYSQISKSMNDQMYATLGNSGTGDFGNGGVTVVAVEPRRDDPVNRGSESTLRPRETRVPREPSLEVYQGQDDQTWMRSRHRQAYQAQEQAKPARSDTQGYKRPVAVEAPDSIQARTTQKASLAARQVPNLDKRLQEERASQLTPSQVSHDDQEHYTLRRQSSSPDESRLSERDPESDWLQDKQEKDRVPERRNGNGRQNDAPAARKPAEVVTLSGRLPFSSSLFDDEAPMSSRLSYQVPGVDKIGLKLHSSNGGENGLNTDRQTSEAQSGPVDSLHGEVDPTRWKPREENPYIYPSQTSKNGAHHSQLKPKLPSEPVAKYQDPFQFASLDDPQALLNSLPNIKAKTSDLSDSLAPERTSEHPSNSLVRSTYQARQDHNLGDSGPTDRVQTSTTPQPRRTDTKPKLQPLIQREYTFSDTKELTTSDFDFKKKDPSESRALPDLSGNKMMTSTFNEASNQDLEGFVQILKKILLYSERVEELKNNIFRTPNFSLLHHFTAFDFEEKGFLTFNEFSQMCNSFKISLSRDDLLLYLQRMLKNTTLTTDTTISADCLALCFSPIDTHGRPIKLRKTQTDNDDIENRVSALVEVPYMISKQLQQVVQLQRKLHDEIIKGLKLVNFFARKSVFNLIVHGTPTTPEKLHLEAQTGSSLAGMTWEDLKSLLETHQVEFYEEDLNFIFLEFRASKPRFISLTEYLNFFRVYGAKA